MTLISNSSTQETEAGRWQVPGQPGLARPYLKKIKRIVHSDEGFQGTVMK
jgi:hypothetical protein